MFSPAFSRSRDWAASKAVPCLRPHSKRERPTRRVDSALNSDLVAGARRAAAAGGRFSLRKAYLAIHSTDLLRAVAGKDAFWGLRMQNRDGP